MWTFVTSLVALVAMVAAQRVDFDIDEASPAFAFVGNIASAAGLLGTLNTSITNNLRFSVLSQDEAFFSVDEFTGDVRTDKVVDRDVTCPKQVTCEVHLQVAALSSPSFYQSIDVYIRINDKNDEVPAFPQSPIQRSIPENTPVGYSISLPEAIDQDSPQYGVLSYRMLTVSEEFEFEATDLRNGHFKLYLVVKKELDREVRSSYELAIVANDNDRDGELIVSIDIIDVNDNRPEFSSDILEVSIPENTSTGTTIVSVSASDADDGSNGQVSYAFSDQTLRSNGDLFSIDPSTGDIIIEQELDYDNAKTRITELVVEARDQGMESLPAIQTVIVNVTDVNDNPPAIKITPLTLNSEMELTESSPPGTYVAHILVTDPDSGEGGLSSCSLNPPSDSFRIETQQGYKLRLSSALDREDVAEHDLVFQCTDQGQPPQTSTQEIKITILDENDIRPEFNKQVYSVVVQENNAIGQHLTMVSATDGDVGPNGAITYSLHGLYSDFVRVDPTTGNVTATTVFDYERYHNFSVEVRATDNGKPKLNSSALLYVTIVDQNDEPPRFLTERVTFVILENQEAPYQVGQVTAEEIDEGEFVYSLVQDGIKLFSIDPLSGWISTRMALDREERTGYEFIVKAVDTQLPQLSSTSSVSVYISDINDNTPVIEFPQDSNNTIHISDKTPIDYIVAQVNAHDEDIGENGRLRFQLTGGNGANLFRIDENSGTVWLSESVRGMHNDRITISISVADRGSPPMVTDCLLNIVVNKSLPVPGTYTKHSILESNNVTILISVAVVSGVVIVILLVAIVMVKRQDVGKRRRNYLPTIFGDHSNLMNSTSRSNSDIPPVKPLDHNGRPESPRSDSHQLATYSNEVDTTDELPPKYDGLQTRPQSASIQPDNRILYQQRYAAPSPGASSSSSRRPPADQPRLWESNKNDELAEDDRDSDSVPSEGLSITPSQDSGRGSHDGSMAESDRPGFGRQYQDHARLTPSKQPNSHHVSHPRPNGSTSRPEYGQRRAPPPLPLNSRQNDGGNLSTSVGNISLGRTRSQDSADSVFFLSASHV
ncbi:hypothetical protein CAPTEDRAFT_222588 [Capitella teleta]|uniref:Cadherin domain-containing protein n=1 Tax=Capitella teleta TaxID=283909 RepID=R7V6F0_CAPTE|nr:hypothetical protein CAPTEDRAFT_222588 [Capitella teleta]|eukprot:ELU14042.1 hypothetical protein CAPTEDRAFT_222588 [Capitella teleta]